MVGSQVPRGKFPSIKVLSPGGAASSGAANNMDEVAIVVGGRKNSTTKAVRRNSAEHQVRTLKTYKFRKDF